jgi:RNA polymerase sigma factor (sigma-70 family)
MSDTLLTRLSLLFRIRDPDDNRSWHQFHARYQPVVVGYCRSKGLNQEDADDVCQIVFVHVARKIADFRHSGKAGSFRSWLFRVTRWRIQDRFRRNESTDQGRAPQVSGDDPEFVDIESYPSAPETDPVWEKEWNKARLARALDELRGQVKPHQYQAFIQVELENVDPAEVARFHGVSRATVYVWSNRLKHRLKRIMDNFERGKDRL